MKVTDIEARRAAIDEMPVDLGMHNELHKLYFDILGAIAECDALDLRHAEQMARAALGRPL